MSESPLSAYVDIGALGKRSRIMAWLTFAAGVAVLAGMVAAVVILQGNIKDLDKQQTELQRQIVVSRQLLAQLKVQGDEAAKAQKRYAEGDVGAASAILNEIAAAQPAGQATGQATGQPSATPRAGAPVARIFFQIRDAGQVPQYRACVGPLGAAGFRTPAYELVDRGPGRTELRYFREEDRAVAVAAQTVLQSCLGGPVSLSRPHIPGVSGLQFELWLAE